MRTLPKFRKILWRSVIAPVLAGFATCAIFAALTINLLKNQDWVDHTQRVLTQAALLHRTVFEIEASVRGFVITGEERFLEYYEEAKSEWTSGSENLKILIKDNPSQTEKLIKVVNLTQDYFQFTEDLIAARKLNFNRAIEIVSSGQGKKFTDQIRVHWHQFKAVERDYLAKRSQDTSDSARLLMMITVVTTTLISALIALWGRKQVLDLSNSYEVLAQDQLAKTRTLEHNEWLKTHQMKLMASMLGALNLNEFGDRILNLILDISHAKAGAFFIKNETGGFQRITDVGLLQRDSSKPNVFENREGLLSRLLEKRRVELVKDLPPDYFKLESGLGSADSKFLLIVPIFARETVVGALELGFLVEPNPRTIEFLNLATESMGSSLQSIQDNLKLEKLLHEIQNQAEELQAQEEELRVSNEELETQMRLVKESQTYTETQNSQLEETNYQLQSQALILEEQKNLLESRNAELMHIRSEVERKAKELERASQYKSEFLANMSHELRTPLNSTLILAQLLVDNKEGHLDEKEVEYCRHILSSGNDLLVLINDILDLSKVESGKLELNCSEFSLNTMLNSLKNTFLPIARAKSIPLEVDEVSKDISLYSDRLRIEQILKNLISNAIKFTDQGYVRLSVVSSDSKLEFRVSDSGIGIPPEHQQSIFEAFKQADGTTSRKYGGTGLGLSISKSLSELLGGTIELQSTPGEGSTFTLKIPRTLNPTNTLSTAKQELPHPTKSSEPQSPKAFIEDDRAKLDGETDKAVLIVEDDPTFASAMRDVVRNRGFKCIVCDTAESAMTIANSHPLKFVILDIQLPDHSGLIVLDQLKRNPKTRYIPVQVISGQDFTSQAYELGAVGYIVKPVVKERLERVLTELEGKFSKESRSVLIIEDDEIQQVALRNLLEDEHLKITSVNTGKDALDSLKSNDFDCVIMDLNLPDMSGFDLLNKFSQDKNFNCPPIVIYTGKDLSSSEERELKQYSGSIIVKGARSPERLLDEVMLYLYRVDSSLPQSHKKILKGLKDKDQSLAGKNILLVDDDMRNIFALAAGLEKKGARILIAKDGLEALASLETHTHIDIVLMDIMMPNMDGYTAIKEIRKMKKFIELPIVAVTAKAMSDDRDKALEAGADDYISKPVDMDRLISLIRIWTMRVN